MAANLGGGAEGLFGNETIRTIVIWGVLMQLASPLLEPTVTDIRQRVWPNAPLRAMDPAQAIDAAIKGHLTEAEARAILKIWGFDQPVFDPLLASAGEPPSWDVLLAAWRRGFILKEGLGPDATSLEQGIRESRLKNKWTTMIEQLQWRLPDPSTVIEGWLRAQIQEPEARDLLRKQGVDQETGTLMFNSAGRPPGPMELIELWRRKFIPRDGLGPDQLTLQQGFFETDLKNKWFETWTHLAEYLPPPRTITALVREGAMTDAQAKELYEKSGLSPELAAIYISAAHHQRTTADKELAKADVLTLFRDRLIARPVAEQLLETLHYSRESADFLLSMEDFREAAALYQGAVNRLRSLFLRRKLEGTPLHTALKDLGVPEAQLTVLIDRWTIERQQLVEQMTAAEWVTAAFYGIISQADALDGLHSLGWHPWDAWVRLGVRLHGKPDVPEPARRALGQ
jgi:hypothetical protein